MNKCTCKEPYKQKGIAWCAKCGKLPRRRETRKVVGHEFDFSVPRRPFPMRCKHCKKLFVYCVNRNGTLNTKCVKRRETP